MYLSIFKNNNLDFYFKAFMDVSIWGVPVAVIVLQFVVINIAKSLGSKTATKSKKNYHFARKIQHCSTGLAIFLFKRNISHNTACLAAVVGFLFIFGV